MMGWLVGIMGVEGVVPTAGIMTGWLVGIMGVEGVVPTVEEVGWRSS
jgi:hypothetical protein